MVVTTSVRALSLHDNICTCDLTFSYHVHYIYSDLRRHFLIDGYGIFPSSSCTVSHPRTMSAYDLYISFYLYFVPTMYPVLYTSISTLFLIPSPTVSILDTISSWFDLTLTKFPTASANL